MKAVCLCIASEQVNIKTKSAELGLPSQIQTVAFNLHAAEELYKVILHLAIILQTLRIIQLKKELE